MGANEAVAQLIRAVGEDSPTLGEVLERGGDFDRCARSLHDSGVERTRRIAAFFVPGRIEVLGKHTDYAGGRSLLAATSRGFHFLAAPRTDRTVTITDAATGAAASFSFDPTLVVEEGWLTYPMTVVRRVARDFPGMVGADIVFESDLPQAAGLSSSSALVIGTFLALAACDKLAERDVFRRTIRSREELADYLAAVESGRGYRELAGDHGVGTRGGSQDHTAILNARAEVLVQYAFAPVRLERRVRLHDDLTFAIASSGVRAVKTGNALERYNHAAASAAQIVGLWREATGRDEATLGTVLGSGPDVMSRLRRLIETMAHRTTSATDLVMRLEQFAAEAMGIVPAAGDAFETGDLAALGALVDRSQRLAEVALGNQVPETTHLAGSARALGAVAASAFGAGFGGSVWALVELRRAAGFLERWQSDYHASFPERDTKAEFFTTRPGPPTVRRH